VFHFLCKEEDGELDVPGVPAAAAAAPVPDGAAHLPVPPPPLARLHPPAQPRLLHRQARRPPGRNLFCYLLKGQSIQIQEWIRFY
jgi:hypothetical protein